jgi:aspartyl-tRNA(Asn)/glutamyl-tRNA(Gln) amidotransferase subunit A
VTRLRDAGAIVIGKTTVSEFGWTGVSRSPLTGITHNPWKQGYNAGASSAGAGFSGAAGFANASRTGGSEMRVSGPAIHCTGLKPAAAEVAGSTVPDSALGVTP